MGKDIIEEIKQIIQSEKLDIDFNISDELLIEKFQDKINWYTISGNQKLSEEFIREFSNKVYWDYICKYQKLSEEFIREFWHVLDRERIAHYQKLSDDFLQEFKLENPKNNWLYTTKQEKIDYIKANIFVKNTLTNEI